MSYTLSALFFASILISSGSILPFALGQNATVILSPLQQLKNGISAHDVKCKQGLMLVMKTSNSPACVKPQTAQKLIERGWGVFDNQEVWVQVQPLECRYNPWDRDWLQSHNNDSSSFQQVSDTEIIKNYFNKLSITIFDIRGFYIPTAHQAPVCGSPSEHTLYFLVLESDASKLTNEGHKLLGTEEPCNPKENQSCYYP